MLQCLKLLTYFFIDLENDYDLTLFLSYNNCNVDVNINNVQNIIKKSIELSKERTVNGLHGFLYLGLCGGKCDNIIILKEINLKQYE